MKALSKALGRVFAAPKEKRPDVHRKSRERAKLIAEGKGIEIEKLPGGGFNVWPPKSVADTENDPFVGDHYADDWDDVLAMVERYSELHLASEVSQ